MQPTSSATRWSSEGLKVRIVGPGMGLDGKTIVLDRPFARIGRFAASDILLDHPLISRWHVYLHRFPEGVYFVDLGSREGLIYRGQQSRQGWLSPDKPLRLQPYELYLETTQSGDGSDPLAVLSDEADKLIAAELCFTIRPGSESRHRLKRRLTLVGRQPPSNLRLQDPGVAHTHLALYRTQEKLWLVNLVGAGAYRDGKLIGVESLADGDELRLAGISLRAKISAPGSMTPLAPTAQVESGVFSAEEVVLSTPPRRESGEKIDKLREELTRRAAGSMTSKSGVHGMPAGRRTQAEDVEKLFDESQPAPTEDSVPVLRLPAVAEQNEQMRKLTQELSEAANALRLAQARCVELERQVESLSADLDVGQRQQEFLRTEIERANQEKGIEFTRLQGALEASQVLTATAERQTVSVREEMAAVEAKWASEQARGVKEINALRDEIDALRRSLTAETSRREELASQRAKDQCDLESLQNEMERQAVVFAGELESREREIAQLRTSIEAGRLAAEADTESMAASVKLLFDRHRELASQSAGIPQVAPLVGLQEELFAYADSLARRLDDAFGRLNGETQRQAQAAEELHALRAKTASLEADGVGLRRNIEQAALDAERTNGRLLDQASQIERIQSELMDASTARDRLADELAKRNEENIRLTESLERQSADREALQREVHRLMNQPKEPLPTQPAAGAPSTSSAELDHKDLRMLIDQVRDLTKMFRQPHATVRQPREVLEPDDVLPPDELPTVEDWREPIQREMSEDEELESTEVAAWRPPEDDGVIEESLPPVQNDPHLMIAETFLSRAADSQEGINFTDLAKRYWFIGLLVFSLVAFLAWLIPTLLSSLAPNAF